MFRQALCILKTVSCALAMVGLLTVPAAASIIYDATAEFSVTDNPNGVWSYGYWGTIEDPDTFTTYDYVQDLEDLGQPAGVKVWHRAPAGTWDPGVAYNTTDSVIVAPWGTYNPHQIYIGPAGPNPNGCIVRWTAPASGTYAVSALFTRVSLAYGASTYAETQGWVGSEKMYTLVGDGTWSGTYTVASGETIDFVARLVEDNPFTNVPTQLNATITLVPEPSALVLVSTALLGLLAYAWKKRR